MMDNLTQPLPYSVDVPGSLGVFLVVITTVTAVIGAIGNTIVLLLFCKHKSLRIAPNMFMFNLTLVDWFMCVFYLPVLVMKYVMKSMYAITVLENFCKIGAFLMAMVGFVSIFSLLALSIERCFVISSLRRTHIFRTNRLRVCLVIILIWLFSGIIAVAPFFGFGRYVMVKDDMGCSFDSKSHDYLNIAFNITIQLCFVIPGMIIFVCYVQIYRTVRCHERQYFKHGCQISRMNRSGRKRRADLKIAVSGAILVIVFCLSWLPYSIICWISLFGDDSKLTNTMRILPELFAKISTVFNSLLYALLTDSFKRKFFLFVRKNN